MNYADKLKLPEWFAKRNRIVARDRRSCLCCGTHADLVVHHFSYTGEWPWEGTERELETLCAGCHGALGHHPKGGVGWFAIFDSSGRRKKLWFVVKHCPECGFGIRGWREDHVPEEMSKCPLCGITIKPLRVPLQCGYDEGAYYLIISLDSIPTFVWEDKPQYPYVRRP